MPSMEVMRSEGWTDQMVANTCWTPWWPLIFHSEGCWLEPHWTVIPDWNSPGQLLSVQVAGSDLSMPDPRDSSQSQVRSRQVWTSAGLSTPGTTVQPWVTTLSLNNFSIKYLGDQLPLPSSTSSSSSSTHLGNVTSNLVVLCTA